MSVDSAIAFFRQRQADLFRDEAIIERPATTTPTLNTTTGVVTPGAPTQLYSGPCLIRGVQWEGSDAVVGGDDIRIRRYQIKFPVDTVVEVYDVVRPTVSTYDASMVGRSFWVTDVARDGWQIARWVYCKEVTGDG